MTKKTNTKDKMPPGIYETRIKSIRFTPSGIIYTLVITKGKYKGQEIKHDTRKEKRK